MKILVVDDDFDQLTIRCMLLCHHGFETIPAREGASAMRLAAAQKPSCAVVDLRIPTQEIGLDLIRKLKSINPQMLVFVLTGGTATQLEDRPELSLIEEVFVKGTSSKALIQALRRTSAQHVA
jgi:DNA-binding NtrC family response regulator